MEIRTSGYSIWLEPEGEVKEKLSGVIENLAREYSTPVFAPHVTLVGGLQGTDREVIRFTRELTSKITPYSIMLTGQVGCEEIWQKAMFVRVRETALVMAANQLSRERFKISGDDPYHPHLSLMYSDTIPLERRLEIARGLNSSDITGHFSVAKIHLYKTQGRVEEWVKLAEYNLG